jgi:DNA-binding MarR family transcriptional regulator
MCKKLEAFRVTRPHDRRVKLSEEDREVIRIMYEHGDSLRALGRMFGVDKGTIRAVVDPEYYRRKLDEAKGNWIRYYDSEKHAAYTRNHRQYKRQLMKGMDKDDNTLPDAKGERPSPLQGIDGVRRRH